jgi:hypothetical protein
MQETTGEILGLYILILIFLDSRHENLIAAGIPEIETTLNLFRNEILISYCQSQISKVLHIFFL